MTKQEARKRLEAIVEHSSGGNYQYAIKLNDWEKVDPDTGEIAISRTYLEIAETRLYSKHYKIKKYGYIDNLSGEYIPEKNNIFDNYTFNGSRF